MITFDSVNKNYTLEKIQINALKDINLTIKENEIVGIYGPSGSGKSTILKLINQLINPDNDIIFYKNKSFTEMNKNELKHYIQKTSLIFQNFNLVSNLSIIDNVALPLRLMKIPKEEARIEAIKKLRLVNLIEHANKYPNQLSGGQQQRVAIARALMGEPEILLCDEITSALDYEHKLEILNLLKSIKDKFNISIVLVSHEHEVIKYLAERVLIIEEGQIIDELKINNLDLLTPLSKYKEVFSHDS